ncbi:RDD family protein [Synoicihabitans lomoniglobus]|uniref:RDD family protein n=1 Tax=Synoicihabitans lomoniglobus TaxID=2909285 RepID=A0AAF0I3X3_9BACT|nr:RDD family protein [Opitutaceae bacterium LMO-M01]WED66538.1 RDD family protein [Opitutaceae bacterium LMO-M01]
MTVSSSTQATAVQRVLAATINLLIVIGLGFAAELIVYNAPDSPTRTFLAAKAAFGLVVLFWLGCAQMRTSPGLALMKLRVVPTDAPRGRMALMTAIVRPMPFLLFGLVMAFPVGLIPRSLASVQFLLVLGFALFLAANASPIWSGPERRSLMDKWLNTTVVRK